MRKDSTIKRNLLLTSNSDSFQFKEAYKTLRTNINFMSVANKYNKIIVTSSIPGEGKTNVSINLAISLAETGKRVLLIDADMRKPRVGSYLKISKKNKGLTGLLTYSCKFSDTVKSFSKLGLDVITSGAIPPNPSELLQSENMCRLIDAVSSKYDYVIFDTPPVSVVTDAAALGKYVDGAVLVVKQKYTNIETAKLAKKNLESAGVKIIGAILNQYKIKESKKDTGYYYSYEYSYENKDADKKD